MRPNPEPIADALASGLVGVGEAQPVTRITVDENWYLNPTSGLLGSRAVQKLPVRWWQSKDEASNFAASEVELPNLKTVVIDRSMQNQAGTIQVVMYNTVAPPNGEGGDVPDAFGSPGYFSYARGQAGETSVRWGQKTNSWKNLLRENALLRVYQGYGGQSSTLAEAIANGNVELTGVFLVDSVQIVSGSNGGGLLTLNGRDMAKLLIDQPCWPKVIPPAFYTAAGVEYVYGASGVLDGVAGAKNEITPFHQRSYAACSAQDSSNPANNDQPIWGKNPSDILSESSASHYVSEGFTSASGLPWVELKVGTDQGAVSACKIAVPPGYNGCSVYVSIYGGTNLVYTNADGWSPYPGNAPGQGPMIDGVPYVMQFGVDGSPRWVNLPSSYNCQYIRFTFQGLTLREDGKYHAAAWGAGVGALTSIKGATSGEVLGDSGGNYFDYAEIVYDFCLWAGFFLEQPVVREQIPPVFGVIENTGAWNTIGPILGSAWDKQPLYNNIQQVAQIVGFLFRIGERGEVFFHPPNFWAPGNYDENNVYLGRVFPVLDEMTNLISYTQTTADTGLLSDIIVAPEDPYLFGGHPNNFKSNVGVTRFTPPNIGSLRGIQKPAMLGVPLNVPIDLEDQNALAELIAVQCYLTNRQGQAQAVFDPSITPDTQIKIYDRTTGEANLHYVTDVHTEHDLDQGTHIATYSTYWLGEVDNFIVKTSSNSFLAGSQLSDSVYNDYGFLVSETLVSFLGRSGSERVKQVVGSYDSVLTSNAGNPANKYSSQLNRNAWGDTGLTPITATLQNPVGDPVGYLSARTADYQLGTVTQS